MKLFNTYPPASSTNHIKNSLNEDIAGMPCTSISLQLLIHKLVGNLTSDLLQNKIVIVNEISPELKMLADLSHVVPVINEILTTVVANGRNTCILITAEKITDIVTLNIQDRNNFNGYALSFSLMSIGRDARFIGGDISIDGAQKRVATVSFSFPDTPGIKRYAY